MADAFPFQSASFTKRQYQPKAIRPARPGFPDRSTLAREWDGPAMRRPGDYRNYRDGRRRKVRERALRTQSFGSWFGHRRLRHRVFVTQPSAGLPRRHVEDRSSFRIPYGWRYRDARNRPTHNNAGSPHGLESGCRRGGNSGPGGLTKGPWM